MPARQAKVDPAIRGARENVDELDRLLAASRNHANWPPTI